MTLRPGADWRFLKATPRR